jgi:hypothetical protein
MRTLFLLLLLSLLAWPASAATTVNIPLNIDTSNFTFQVVEGIGITSILKPPQPGQSLPFTQRILPGPDPYVHCGPYDLTVSAEIVDGALEVDWSGTIESSGVSSGGVCDVGGRFTFDVVIQVPELGGTVTISRMIAEVVDFSFSNFHRANMVAGFGWGDGLHSSTLGFQELFPPNISYARWDWYESLVDPSGMYARPFPLIPGDVLTGQFIVEFTVGANLDNSASGSGRFRPVFRTFVPEPSAALSIPIGVLGLASLAAIKGGG